MGILVNSEGPDEIPRNSALRSQDKVDLQKKKYNILF